LIEKRENETVQTPKLHPLDLFDREATHNPVSMPPQGR
jgi:hypothetical protein